MIRHNLRRVRMNPTDASLHCVQHGLLSRDEALDVFTRAGEIDPADALKRLGLFARVFDWLASRLPARCEVAS